ncbi:sugar transferase [Erysipelothrix urinaevulpis]|uniref:sugar transferase n=1 Tax=Erysipelothrix urinaevulpis TaxID=2683717 RepID=UPI00135A2E0A|nr:sugar transferase [Erysipelothrix urinaevulpis]
MTKNIKEFIVLLVKVALYSLLFTVFFVVFATKNIGLAHLSRTMVITMMTFVIVGVLMLIVYGNFRIGEEKSKPIIYSTMLAVLITDVITYLQLMIMNTNPSNNVYFQIEHVDLFLIVFMIQFALIVVFAYLGNHIYFKLFKPMKTVIIYDEDEESLHKVKHMISRYKLQYELIGVVDSYDDLAFEIIQDCDFVVLLDMDANRRDLFAEFCYEFNIDFTFESSMASIIAMSGHHVVIDDKPMVDVSLNGLSIEQKIFKRLMDLVVSVVGLVVLSPFLLITAILIKADDGGRIFFLQERYTQNGRIFKVIKFRTMKENVANYSATADDDRITKAGAFLRKTRIDELPQLINVLLGDMSLVGPRPEMLENVHKYEGELPEFRYRLKVKAGVTGVAQIEGKYNTSPMDKLLLDMVYIENFSVWNDMRLILRTLIVVFKKDSTEGFDEKEGK